ncbi:hypothetical protein [Micromonospora sp. NPDC049662]|uniref:hypothetical protein n=1 Tax=unclassified Micromonospora TaxID=2617518 RepID=UPI003425F2BB
MLTYVRWYSADDDRWNYEELDADGWALRHVEVRVSDGVVVAAASLAEVLIARDSGIVGAVGAYEQRYGVVPEAPFPLPAATLDPALENVSPGKFKHLWRNARRQLEQQTGT